MTKLGWFAAAVKALRTGKLFHRSYDRSYDMTASSRLKSFNDSFHKSVFHICLVREIWAAKEGKGECICPSIQDFA